MLEARLLLFAGRSSWFAFEQSDFAVLTIVAWLDADPSLPHEQDPFGDLLVCRLAQLLFRRAQEHGKLGAEMVHELLIFPLDGLCAHADLQRLSNDLLKRDHVLEWNRLRRGRALRPVGQRVNTV